MLLSACEVGRFRSQVFRSVRLARESHFVPSVGQACVAPDVTYCLCGFARSRVIIAVGVSVMSFCPPSSARPGVIVSRKLVPLKPAAQQGVHPMSGSLRVFKPFAWLEVGSGKEGLSRPAQPPGNAKPLGAENNTVSSLEGRVELLQSARTPRAI